MAKKSDGTRNFYRFVAVIGVVVIGSLGYSFISAAPNLNTAPYHKPPPTPTQCMECHITGKEKIPITKDGLYLISGTGKPNDHIVEVEDPTAEQGHLNNAAKIKGPGPTPTYNPKTGLFE